MDPQDLCNHTKIRLIAAALGHQKCTATDGTEVLIPGTGKRILIGDDAYLARAALPAGAELTVEGRPPLPWNLDATKRSLVLPLRAGEVADAMHRYAETAVAVALARRAPAPAAPADERVVFLRQDSSFGPWIECDADHVNAVRFVAAHQAAPAQPSAAPNAGSNMYRKTALVKAEQFLPAEGKIPHGVYSDGHGDPRKDTRCSWALDTKEGKHYLRNGDYICTGPQGEQWNVERSIFESTYELAAAPTSDQQVGAVAWANPRDLESDTHIDCWAYKTPNYTVPLYTRPTAIKGFELVDCGTCGCQVSLPVEYALAAPAAIEQAKLTPHDSDIERMLDDSEQAGAQPVEPIYQVKRTKHGGGWIDTYKSSYDSTADWNRHIVYLAASTPATDQDALDAKRYRWLRDHPWSFDLPELAQIIQLQQNALWDESIDTAMTTTPVTDQPKQGDAS